LQPFLLKNDTMADPKKKNKKQPRKKNKGNPGNPGTKGKKKKPKKKTATAPADPRTAMVAQMAMAGAMTGIDYSKSLPAPSASTPRPTAAQVAAMQKLTQDNTGLADRLKQITGSGNLQDWAAYFKQLPETDMQNLVEWGRADTGAAKDEKPGLLDKLLGAWRGTVADKEEKAKKEEEIRKRTQTWIIIGAAAFAVLLLVAVLVMGSGRKTLV
jgi:hypothetical protein